MELSEKLIKAGLPANFATLRCGCLEVSQVEGDGQVYTGVVSASSVQMTGSLVLVIQEFFWFGTPIHQMFHDGKEWTISHGAQGRLPVKVVFKTA